MSDKYTYEHPFLEGNALENTFKGLEDVYIPRIKEILELLENNRVADAKVIIESIMKYVLLFYYRSGAILYEFSDGNDFSKEYVIDSMLGRVGDSRYLERLSATVIKDYNFLVVKAPNAELALSDQYVSTASLNCKGMITKYSNRTIGFSECLILIPLSAKYYAVYYNGGFTLSNLIHNDEIYLLDSEDVIMINKVIVRNSYRKCVAMHQNELEQVKDYKSKIVGPSGIIVKIDNGSYQSCTIKKEVFYYDRDEDIFENYIRYYSDLVAFKMEHKRHIGRNDMCLCGSGIKFKKCCFEKYQQANYIASMIKNKKTNWLTTESNYVEKPINEFWGIETDLPKQSQDIIRGLREIGTDGLDI